MNSGSFIISVGNSRRSTHWEPRTLTWDEFVGALRTPRVARETMAEYKAMSAEERADAKDVGGYIGGMVLGGARKADNVTSRQLIALDADYAAPGFWDEFSMLFDNAACMYSTRSHTPETPRLRLLLPLSRPVSVIEYEAIGRLIASDIGIDQFDDTTYQPNRLMYWPSVCKDGEYLFEAQDGPWLDPDEVLDRYQNWRDTGLWPRSERAKDIVRSSAQKAGKPQEKPGIIGAFCRVYDVPAAINAYLTDYFDPAGDGRYTYHGGTTYGGVIILDDGDFMYSYHDHDPYHGRLLNAFDAVRLHLYGHLDRDVDTEDIDMSSLPSMIAMAELCGKDKDVAADLRANIEARNSDESNADHRFIAEYQDKDIARLIAAHYKGKLLYHESLGWLYWTGTYWKPGAFNDCMRCMSAELDGMLIDALTDYQMAADPDEKKRAGIVLKKVRGLRSAGKIFGFERLLRTQLPLETVDALDPNPWELNTPEGIVNLKTGDLRPCDPLAMCSHITGCAVASEDGPMPMWRSFLAYATQGDKELEDYLQLICGMAAVGKVYEEGMFMVYGPGGNGKSTMFGTVMACLGDYATTIRSSVLIDKGNGNEPYGMDAARGRRLVLMSELDDGARLSVSTMKALTSRDIIQVNPKYERTFSFRPTHKLILHTNYLPELSQFDNGTKRRIAVVPFTARPKEGRERVPDLAGDMFDAEGPQILRWICQGAQRFWTQGTQIGRKPAVVEAATAEYLQDEDWMAKWLNECCIVGERCKARGRALYEAYRKWADENGMTRPKNMPRFAKELSARGFKKYRDSRGFVWLGLSVSEAWVNQDYEEA